MELVFIKGAGKYDRMRVVRDEVAEDIACPKQHIIPHDMMHFAVESTLETRGFLSRVRDGESTDWQMGSTAESDGVERLVEVFQGDAWSGDEASPAEMLDLYRVTCNARDCPPLQVTVDDIEAVRGKIHALDAQWQALAIGESMSLML